MGIDRISRAREDQKQLAATASVLTALTITGAVVFIFSVLGPSMNFGDAGVPLWLAIPLGVLVLSSAFLVGGGVWGWGMAAALDLPRWPAAKTGALTVTGVFMLLEVPVHFTQALPVPDWMPLDIHGVFTLVFAIEISLVAGVASVRLAKRLGVENLRRRLGANVGLAGAIGAVIGSFLTLVLGFRVGHSPPSNMVRSLYVVVAVAGLTSGWVFGWLLADHQKKPSNTRESEAIASP